MQPEFSSQHKKIIPGTHLILKMTTIDFVFVAVYNKKEQSVFLKIIDLQTHKIYVIQVKSEKILSLLIRILFCQHPGDNGTLIQNLEDKLKYDTERQNKYGYYVISSHHDLLLVDKISKETVKISLKEDLQQPLKYPRFEMIIAYSASSDSLYIARQKFKDIPFSSDFEKIFDQEFLLKTLYQKKDTLFVIILDNKNLKLIDKLSAEQNVGGIYIITEQKIKYPEKSKVIFATNDIQEIASKGIFQIQEIDVFRQYFQNSEKERLKIVMHMLQQINEEALQCEEQPPYKFLWQNQITALKFSYKISNNQKKISKFLSLRNAFDMLENPVSENLVYYLKKQLLQMKRNFQGKLGGQYSQHYHQFGKINAIQQQIISCSISKNTPTATFIACKLIQICYESNKKQSVSQNMSCGTQYQDLLQKLKVQGLKDFYEQIMLQLQKAEMDKDYESTEIMKDKEFFQERFSHLFLDPKTFLKFFLLLYTSQTAFCYLFNKQTTKLSWEYIHQLSAYLIRGIRVLGEEYQEDINDITRLFRGIRCEKSPEIAEQKYIWPCFTSTSQDRKEAKLFAQFLSEEDLKKKKNPFLYSINLIQNNQKAHGRPKIEWMIKVQNFSMNPSEKEYLVLPGFQFKVTSVDNLQIKNIEVQQLSDRTIIDKKQEEEEQYEQNHKTWKASSIKKSFHISEQTERIYMNSKKLTTIPKQVQILPRITHIFLNHNSFHCIPCNVLKKWDNSLCKLTLNSNPIKLINFQKIQFRVLMSLQLNDCQIEKIGINGNMPSLASLKVRRNKIEWMDLGKLQFLDFIDLSGNSFGIIPAQVFKFTSLKRLYLQDNLSRKIEQTNADFQNNQKYLQNYTF